LGLRITAQLTKAVGDIERACGMMQLVRDIGIAREWQ
jgi:DNA-binding phage protein